MWFSPIEVALNTLLLLMLGRMFVVNPSRHRSEFNREATVPLRAILAFCVITTHIPPCQKLDLGTIAVSVFFFMSGYGMVKSVKASHVGGVRVGGMVFKLALKLFLPYLVCAIPWMMRMAVFKNGSDGRVYGFDYLVQGVSTGDFGVFLPNSWFPWTLFVFGASFIVAVCFGKRFRAVVLLMLLVIYYCLVRFGCKWGVWWWVTTWAYPLGAIFSVIEGRVIAKLDAWGWRLPLGALLIYGCLQIGAVYVFPGVPVLSELPHSMTGAFVALALMYYPLPRFRWLIFLGGVSYEIYLVHGVIWAFVARSGLPIFLAVLTTYIFTPVIAFIVNRVSCAFIRKIGNPMGRGM